MGVAMRHVSLALDLGFLLLLATTGLLTGTLWEETGPRANWLEVLLLIVGAGLLLAPPSQSKP